MTTLGFTWISRGSFLRVTFGPRLLSPLTSHLLWLFLSFYCTDGNEGLCPLPSFPKYHSQQKLVGSWGSGHLLFCLFNCPPLSWSQYPDLLWGANPPLMEMDAVGLFAVPWSLGPRVGTWQARPEVGIWSGAAAIDPRGDGLAKSQWHSLSLALQHCLDFDLLPIFQ